MRISDLDFSRRLLKNEFAKSLTELGPSVKDPVVINPR
jgi:hypothetical protein